MFISVEDESRGSMQTLDTQNPLNSVIVRNESIITRLYASLFNERFVQIWRTNSEMQRHLAASFVLPVGSIFVLGVIILLMVLFKRYPNMIAAIVAAILGIIIIFTTLVAINKGPIYI